VSVVCRHEAAVASNGPFTATADYRPDPLLLPVTLVRFGSFASVLPAHCFQTRRYDKPAANDLAFDTFESIRVSLRANESTTWTALLSSRGRCF
jgi:hypothetical protein